MRRLVFLPAVLIALAASGPSAAGSVSGRPNVEDRSVVEADGGRILSESIVIAAPKDAVWKAFATSEGLKSWEAPVASIELRVGGFLEASYDPKARLGDPNNIKHEVLGYLPGELLLFRNVQAPKGFKHADLFARTTTIIQLEDLGQGRTRITVSGVGYGPGKEFGELYDFFHAGNAYLLEMLKAHFEGGPGPTGPAHPADPSGR
jgi:uncharacterized protein YndB with AHSA1/START domain